MLTERNCKSCKQAIVLGSENEWVHVKLNTVFCYPWTPVAEPEIGLTYDLRPIFMSPAEIVHLASDLAQDTRAKIGPRLEAALKVIAAAKEVVKLMEEQKEIDAVADKLEWETYLLENPDESEEDSA